MAPRTSWKGFLKLSLVSVPVKAFTANTRARRSVSISSTPSATAG